MSRRMRLAVASLCLAAACGADHEVRVRAEEVEPTPLAGLEVGEWDSWAAADGMVFGFRRPRAADRGEALPLGVAIDVRSGATTELPPPPGDGYFLAQEAVGGVTELVIAGVWCPSVVLDESSVCDPVTSYAWDAQDGWRQLQVPEGAQFLSDLVVDGRGTFWAVLFGGQLPSRIASLEGDTWRVLGEMPHAENTEICISGDTAYSLARVRDLSDMVRGTEPNGAQETTPPTAENGMSLGPSASLTVTAFSLDDGSSEQVATPTLFEAFGGHGVHLGCTPDGPVLTTATPERGPVAVYRWVHGGWGSPEALADGDRSIVAEIVSTTAGALIVYAIDTGSERDAHALAVTGSGSRVVSGSFMDAEVLPLGTTGQVARISRDPTGSLRVIDLDEG